MPAIPAIALLATVAGAGMAANSAYQGGKQQQAMEQYNAQLALQQQQADAAAGAVKSNLEREQGERRLAQEKAQYTAAGVVISSGSALTVLAKQSGLNELRAQQTEYEAETAGNLEQQQSQLDISQGNADRTAGDENAVGSLLSGAASAAGGYSGFGKK